MSYEQLCFELDVCNSFFQNYRYALQQDGDTIVLFLMHKHMYIIIASSPNIDTVYSSMQESFNTLRFVQKTTATPTHLIETE